MSLVVIPFYAALLTIFYFFLTFRIILFRRSHGVGIGDGGNKTLQRYIRVHGNFSEYIPLALVLLLLVELQGIAAHWVHILGSLLFVGRLLHSLGLSQKAGYSFNRFWGSFFTYLSILASTIILMIGYLKSL